MIKLRQKNKNDSYKLIKDKGHGSDDEETELLVKNKPQRIELSTIDKAVEEGDTLQALAIKYHCSIAELKRINNIHNENEIFAKLVIKVPHRPFTTALASVHISGSSSPESHNAPLVSRLIDIDSVNLKLTENTVQDTDEVNQIVFNSQISQKQKEQVNSEVIEDCADDASLLPQKVECEADVDPVISRLSCNGADADISVKLLLCVVIIIVAVPLFYIYYIAEHPESFHHQHGS